MSASFLFRCDASPSIGGGHLVRSMALAEGLKRKGVEVHLVTLKDTAALFPDLDQAFTSVLYLENDDWQATESIFKKFNEDEFSAVIIDRHESNATYENSLKALAKYVIVISDNPVHEHQCDVLIDSNLDRKEADYVGLLDDDCETLLGPAYILLRQGFSSQKYHVASAESILISVGFTDPENLSIFYLKGLIAAGNTAPVEIVIGHAPDTLKQLNDLKKQANFPIDIHIQVADMVPIMQRAFLVLGAGGGAAWERCALGLPSLTIEIADNQNYLLSTLDKKGAVKHLGKRSDVSKEKLVQELHSIIQDEDARAVMSQKARMLCDGNGVARIIKRILKE